jgi:hypothetical protein
MSPKDKPSAFRESNLTSALSSIARKQNLLAAVPPALRLLPLAALAAGDLYERTYGKNPLSPLLFPGEDAGGLSQIQASPPPGASVGIGGLSLPSSVQASRVGQVSTIASSCGVCTGRGLAGLAANARHVGTLWHGKGGLQEDKWRSYK